MTGLHDTPSPTELIVAVREFLQDQVIDAVDGTTRFHTRVAMNTLRIVERELMQDGADVHAHMERLAALGYADDAALASAIRTGGEDERYGEIKAAIAASVEAKLLVDNPGYLAVNSKENS